MTLRVLSQMDGTSITANGTVTGSGIWMTLDSTRTQLISGGGTGVGGNVGCTSTISNLLGAVPKQFYKFYVENQIIIRAGFFPVPQQAVWGLAQFGADRSGFGDGEHDAGSGLLLYDMATGRIRLGDTVVATADPWGETVGSGGTSQVSEGAFDIANGLAWFRIMGGIWNGDPSADPVTGVGGINFAGSLEGEIYVLGGMQLRANFNGDEMQFNLGQASFQDTVPDGFQPGWGIPTILTGVLHWDGKRVVLPH